jgi:hypothetical protein
MMAKKARYEIETSTGGWFFLELKELSGNLKLKFLKNVLDPTSNDRPLAKTAARDCELQKPVHTICVANRLALNALGVVKGTRPRFATLPHRRPPSFACFRVQPGTGET